MTILNIIESKQITLSLGNNYITSDKLNISLVKKGFIPIIRHYSDSSLMTSKYNSSYPDYVCLNMSSHNGDLIRLKNLTILKNSIGSTTSNIAVKFGFDETIFVNLTVAYAYSSFASYLPYLYTQYGGNYYETPNSKMITIRNIDNYYAIQGKIST